MRALRTVLIQCLVGIALLELCLRVYNPLPARVRGDRIVLPVRQVFRFDNAGTHKLDPITHHTKNTLGFRGPEPPRDLARRLSIVTVGGSTTECLFLSDGHTWTDAFARRVAQKFPGAWVNNAGLDGQSTFGHLVLLRDVLFDLHPKVAIFLIGTNDVERGAPTTYDAALTPHVDRLTATINFGAEHSEVVALVQNFARALRAHRAGFGHTEIDLATVNHVYFDEATRRHALDEHRARYLPGYVERVQRIIDACRSRGIAPVLVTQPALFGPVVDPTTGLDLTEVQVNGRGNGLLEWQLLELYNDATRAAGARNHVLVVDLARELPKDSRYFYDYLHFTNEGAERVGDIIAATVIPWLEQPDMRKNDKTLMSDSERQRQPGAAAPVVERLAPCFRERHVGEGLEPPQVAANADPAEHDVQPAAEVPPERVVREAEGAADRR